MRQPTKGKSEAPAEDSSQTSEYDNGYAHGERLRQRNELAPKHLMFGIDEYALGFRAGYFANVRTAPRAERSGKSS